MATLRFTSAKTMPIIIAALRRLRFTQTMIAQETGISIGRVNKVVAWLQEKGLVVKEEGRYVIARPNAVADLVANQQVVNAKRTFQVSASKEEVLKECRKAGIVLCLQSALSLYEKEFSSAEVHLVDSPEAQAYLNGLPRGEQTIQLYGYDHLTKDPKRNATDEVRTIIDLKAAGQGSIAENAAYRLWGTRQ